MNPRKPHEGVSARMQMSAAYSPPQRHSLAADATKHDEVEHRPNTTGVVPKGGGDREAEVTSPDMIRALDSEPLPKMIRLSKAWNVFCNDFNV